jgi:hypothetical protein
LESIQLITEEISFSLNKGLLVCNKWIECKYLVYYIPQRRLSDSVSVYVEHFKHATSLPVIKAWVSIACNEFVQSDGKSSFDYYSYLVGGTYDPEESKIALTFTTKNVVVTGTNLQPIYEAIMLQQLRSLCTADSRYTALQDDVLPMVAGIEVGD